MPFHDRWFLVLYWLCWLVGLAEVAGGAALYVGGERVRGVLLCAVGALVVLGMARTTLRWVRDAERRKRE